MHTGDVGLNILYVHRTRGKGVEKIHIEGTIDAFRQLGNQVFISSPLKEDDTEPVDKKNKKKSDALIDFACNYFPEPVFEIGEFLFNFILFFRVFSIVRKEKIDLIYSRYAFYEFASYLISKLYRLPIYYEINYLSDNPLVRKRSKLFFKIQKYIELKLLHHATGLAAITRYLKKKCLEDNVDEKKIIHCPNGVNPDEVKILITSDELKKNLKLNGKLVIGFVGGFYKWQGLSLLVDEFLKKTEKTVDVQLLLVGDGPEKKVLEEMVNKSDYKHRFIFAGEVPHREIWSYINLFDISVLPGTNKYGSPMKIFEYLVMGKAVIAPAQEPVKEVLKDQKTGLLFEPGNKEEFSRCLWKAIDDRDLRDELGRAGKKIVNKKFTYKHDAIKIIDHFRKLSQ